MYKHRVFNKGEYCYALISSNSYPNILIPIKCLIKDVKWDDVNPKYKVKILKIYETISFVRKYLFGMAVSHKIGEVAKTWKMKDEKFKTIHDLEKRLGEEDEDRFYIVVDSLMCTKYVGEMKDLFDKIQYYLISKNLSQLEAMMTRNFYKGQFKVDTRRDFELRLKKMMGTLFDKTDESFDEFMKSI